MSPRTGIGLNVVVDAAASIADRDGLDNVTLKAVAAELGIKAPSLYNYFDGVHGARSDGLDEGERLDRRGRNGRSKKAW